LGCAFRACRLPRPPASPEPADLGGRRPQADRGGRCTDPVVFPVVELAIELRVPILHHAGPLPGLPGSVRLIITVAWTGRLELLLDKVGGHTAHTSAELAAELNIELIRLPNRSANIMDKEQTTLS
jgi:hypothetical protein